MAAGVEDEADAVRVDLTPDGRAYLAGLRDLESVERVERARDALSPLVVDGEVRS